MDRAARRWVARIVPACSLRVEMSFYAALPFVAMLASRWPARRRGFAAVAAAVGTLAVERTSRLAGAVGDAPRHLRLVRDRDAALHLYGRRAQPASTLPDLRICAVLPYAVMCTSCVDSSNAGSSTAVAHKINRRLRQSSTALKRPSFVRSADIDWVCALQAGRRKTVRARSVDTDEVHEKVEKAMLNGLMMDDFQLSLTVLVERAERLSSASPVVSRRPDGSVRR